MAYIFGGATGDTPDSLKKKREIADMLAMSIRAPKNVGEGLGAIGNAIAYRAISGRANKAEAAGREQGNAAFGNIVQALSGGMGGSSPSIATEPSTASAPMDYPTQRISEANGMDPLRNGIQQTASALQMDPVDLATIISYETAGTFDPNKKGPTTQWGQHRGLIQFGEPQAKQYGVDWNRPLESQLGPDGAVANYFRENGWKPGMGMLDAYSIVNAGGPGLYNRSDANNGGAPGTVRDKVETQMAGHRAKAAEMFGEQVSPAPVQQGGVQTAQNGGLTPELLQQMQNPWLSEGQQSIIKMLMQQQMQRSDPSNQLDMEVKREQLNQLRNPSPKPTDDMREYEFAKSQGYQGNFTQFMTDMRRAGATTVNVGQGSSKYNETLDKNFADQYIAIQDGAQAARNKMATLQGLNAALGQSGYTGMGAETVLAMRQAGRALGFDVGDLGPEETARALGNQLALQLRNPSSGAGMPGAMSDKDREFLVASVPGLTKTPQGNGRLVEYMMKVEQRNIDVARMAQEYSKRVGQIDNGFYQELADWSAQNPLFPEADAQQSAQPQAGQAGVPEGIDPGLWEVMTPEERALWQN